MNKLDIILIIVVLISFAIGYFKGLISQLTFGMGVVLGLFQAVVSYNVVSRWLCNVAGWNETVCSITSFIGIILTVVLVFRLAGWLISMLLEKINLGFIDKTLGAIFTSIVATLLLVGVANAAHSVMPDLEVFNETTQNSSVLYKHAESVTISILGEVKK